MVESKERKFGALIWSYRRANRLKSWDMLRKVGYTGDIRILVSDDDDQLYEYKARYGEANVIVFSREEAKKIVDTGDNGSFGTDKVAVFAGAWALRVVRELGWTHCVLLDDDLTGLEWVFGGKPGLLLKRRKKVKNLDRVFEMICDYLDSAPVSVVSFISSRKLFGGVNGIKFCGVERGIRRFVWAVYVMRTDVDVEFAGRIAQDFIMNYREAVNGKVLMAINYIIFMTPPLGGNKGGMDAAYKDEDSYVRSFYPIIFSPVSSIIRWNGKECMIGVEGWDYFLPKILRESIRYKECVHK